MVGLRIILCGLLFSAAISAQDLAWWLTARFAPSQTNYENLRIADINPNWEKMLVLSYDAMPPEAKSDLEWMHRDGFVFQVDNFFKRPGIVDRELTGVYREKSGVQGRFLLILERSETALWRVAYKSERTGDSGFSVFYPKDNRLLYGFCMLCDNIGVLSFRRGRYRLD